MLPTVVGVILARFVADKEEYSKLWQLRCGIRSLQVVIED